MYIYVYVSGHFRFVVGVKKGLRQRQRFLVVSRPFEKMGKRAGYVSAYLFSGSSDKYGRCSVAVVSLRYRHAVWGAGEWPHLWVSYHRVESSQKRGGWLPSFAVFCDSCPVIWRLMSAQYIFRT